MKVGRALLTGLAPLSILTLTLLQSAGADRVYRVQPGDSLFSLARSSGASVQTLQRLNGLNGHLLRVGQAIRLPGRATDGRITGPALRAAIPTPSRLSAVYQSGMAVHYWGQRDSRTLLTAAHLTLPFGTWVEVRHTRTGRSVLVLINDRGPFGRPERVIDLSLAAARVLGIMGEGVAPVTLRIARRP